MQITYKSTVSSNSLISERIKIGLFIVALIAIAGTLSLAFFSRESLRLDEAQSLWQTRQEPEQIFRTIAEDVHVPLYHQLLYFWRLFFGESIFVARLFSLVFFLASIPLLYYLARLLYERDTAIFITTLFTISPFLNWYGSEARMYSLMLFLSILNQIFFIQVYRKGRTQDWFGYAVTAVLGIYSHYFFGLTLLAQAVFYFLNWREFPKQSFKKFILSALLVAFSLLPWLYFAYTLGSASNTRPQLQPPSSVNLFNTFSEFMFGFQNDHLNTILVSLWPLTIFFAFFGLRRNKGLSKETGYFILALMIPILSAFVISFIWRPFYLSRYLILALPAFYLIVGWLFSTYPRIFSNAFKFGLIVIMLLSLSLEVTRADAPVKENYLKAMNYINQNAKPSDVVLISAPFTIYPIEYYYESQALLETVPRWNRYQKGSLPEFSEDKLKEDIDSFKNYERAFVLLSYDQGYESAVKNYFDQHFERLYVGEYSRDLGLYVYKLRYDQTQIQNEVQKIVSATSTQGL